MQARCCTRRTAAPHWQTTPVLLAETVLNGIAALNGMVIAAGEYGHILRSTDAGAQWRVMNGFKQEVHQLGECLPARTSGWGFGEKRNHHSYIRWRKQLVGADDALEKRTLRRQDGLRSGGVDRREFGVILHTSDGRYQLATTGECEFQTFCSALISQRRGTAGPWASLGIVVHTTNSGVQWTKQETGAQEYLLRSSCHR